jgi:outer membrane protein OmpA-like peptidoglycan-associated protein
MKTKNNFKIRSRIARSYSSSLRNIFFSAIAITGIQTTLKAQPPAKSSDPKVEALPVYTKPNWWLGVAAGANFNFYQGTTQQLNSSLIVPTAFGHGKGVGLYLAPLVEYHRPNQRLGVMFQAGYDNRAGKFDQVLSPCNCPQNLSTDLSYITVEPSLRFAPFKSNFYLYVGPRLAFNLSKQFAYQAGTNPLITDQVKPDEVKGDFSSVNQMLLSMQVGAGYDILLSSENRRTQTVLSPFVSFQPYFGQSPRSVETWTVTTLRVGAALKFGRGHLVEKPAEAHAMAASPAVKFTVYSPANIPVERRVRETFPIRNYVFFDLGSTKIPDRYVLLNKDQVKDFKEDRLEVFASKKLSGRSSRQMTVYYNVINILGDRMQRNLNANVRLTGASMQGKPDGIAMAESIKQYLVNVFGISPARINVEGRIKPRLAAEQKGATVELDLLRQGDRRVTIWSESPALMLEYQTGPDTTPLKPVEIVGVQPAPVDSYIKINVKGAKKAFTRWSLEVRDEKGIIENFGPYTEDDAAIPGKSILGSRPSGDFKFTMIGQNGTTTKKDTTLHMVLWTPDKDEEGMRFTVIYEFNNSKAIEGYEKYLTDVVAPKIPKGATVIIHGYTDTIGDEDHNKQLSVARAYDVRKILEKSLFKANRTDVKFESYGFGEDQNLSQFNNNYPEERFYNRSVVIDVIPHK